MSLLPVSSGTGDSHSQHDGVFPGSLPLQSDLGPRDTVLSSRYSGAPGMWVLGHWWLHTNLDSLTSGMGVNNVLFTSKVYGFSPWRGKGQFHIPQSKTEPKYDQNSRSFPGDLGHQASSSTLGFCFCDPE